MKFLILACILPFALAGPLEKRIFIQGANPFDLTNLKCDIQLMVDALGSDPTEATCEAECHKLILEGHIFNFACPLVCHGFQNLVHEWHIIPQNPDGSNPCAAVTTAATA